MSDVRVQFLGTGGPFASGGRLQTCILIESNERRYLGDCGMTVLVAMAPGKIAENSSVVGAYSKGG
jgi:ribonuclease BN (tRNA processing enzyme)